MEKLSGLRINQLILIGHRKNYTIPFHPGVNIIYGDADTGKSSILRIIYYFLGGKQLKLDHELTSSVMHAALEININGKPYCIQRDLYNANRNIEIYSCTFGEIKNNFPKKYASSISKSNDDLKSLSEFLLEELDFPAVKLKQAPSRDNSDTARLSFLDLFKYIYLDQDDVGSTHMLNIGNPTLEVKNREVLKYIFNVLDSNISDLGVEISEKTKEQNILTGQYQVISKFLTDTDFDSIEDIDSEISSIEEETEALSSQLSDLNSRIVGDSVLYEGFKDALNTINMNILSYEDKKTNSSQNIERFSRLQNDYKNDIDKLKSAIQAKDVIGREIVSSTSCPICDSKISLTDISEEFLIPEDGKVKQELDSISRRSRDLVQIIADNQQRVSDCASILTELYIEKNKANQFLDEELEKSVSPYLTERDAIVTELAYLKERRSKYQQTLKVRNQHNSIADQIGRLESSVIKLKIKLDELRENAPSIDNILNSLGGDLDHYLEKVNIKNRFGVSISEKSFLPIVRDIEYRHINSGGLRTIVSIGYLAVLLKAKLTMDTNVPSLLMIDTVGKFLGKTKEGYKADTDMQADLTEGVSDPEKYKNIYEYLFDLSEEFENKGKLCQIILVDNDIPPEIALLNKGFEIAHFSTNGVNNVSIGLIDDWDKFAQS